MVILLKTEGLLWRRFQNCLEKNVDWNLELKTLGKKGIFRSRMDNSLVGILLDNEKCLNSQRIEIRAKIVD